MQGEFALSVNKFHCSKACTEHCTSVIKELDILCWDFMFFIL